MKIIKFLRSLMLLALIMCVAVAFGATGDTTATGIPTGLWGLTWAAWGGIILGIYELLARLIPTVSNISILSFIMKIIRFLVPNNNGTGGVFLADPKASIAGPLKDGNYTT